MVSLPPLPVMKSLRVTEALTMTESFPASASMSRLVAPASIGWTTPFTVTTTFSPLPVTLITSLPSVPLIDCASPPEPLVPLIARAAAASTALISAPKSFPSVPASLCGLPAASS